MALSNCCRHGLLADDVAADEGCVLLLLAGAIVGDDLEQAVPRGQVRHRHDADAGRAAIATVVVLVLIEELFDGRLLQGHGAASMGRRCFKPYSLGRAALLAWPPCKPRGRDGEVG